MKTRISSSLLALALFAAPVLAGNGHAPGRVQSLSPAEASRLRAIDATPLGELRAGAVHPAASIDETQRAALTAADQKGAGLDALSAGELTLSDHDLTIIAIVVGVVLILILI